MAIELECGYAPAAVTEPLLKKLEAVVQECLDARVDPEWIIHTVEDMADPEDDAPEQEDEGDA